MYQRVAYNQHILRGEALKKYKAVLLECKQSAEDLGEYKWTLCELKGLSTEDFSNWAKSDELAFDGDAYVVMD